MFVILAWRWSNVESTERLGNFCLVFFLSFWLNSNTGQKQELSATYVIIFPFPFFFMVLNRFLIITTVSDSASDVHCARLLIIFSHTYLLTSMHRAVIGL